jgi:hypothetical protein
MNIPNSPESITSEWLSAALKAGEIITSPVIVRSVQVFPEGLSATGKLARVEIDYPAGETGPSSLIAKLPDPQKTNPFVTSAYEREIRFYREIGGISGVKVPVMYFGGTSDESAIILMEDLRPIEPGDSVIGCSLLEADSAVRELATLHARWWGDELLSADWLWSMAGMASIEEQTARIDSGWKLVPDDYLEGLSASTIATCGVPGWYAGIVKGRSNDPQTLSHPDYRLDNLFFDDRADEIELTVIDWGRVAAQRPGMALALFLTDSGLSNEDIAKCIDIYWRELATKGVTNFSKEDCMSEFRIGVVEVLAMRLWQFSTGSNEGADDRIKAMRKRGWDRLIPILENFACLDAIPADSQ